MLVRRAQSSAYRQFAFRHPSETQRAVVDAFSRDGETRADLAALLGVRPRARARALDAPFDLIGIRCPVLLVWGAHDRMLPHSDARIALGSLPTTQVELIEGAGHRPQLEATGPAARTAAPIRHLTRK